MFINPYAELDEEEEQKAIEGNEKGAEDEDKVRYLVTCGIVYFSGWKTLSSVSHTLSFYISG